MKQATNKIANLTKLVGLAQSFSEKVAEQVAQDTTRCAGAVDALSRQVQASAEDLGRLQQRMRQVEDGVSSATDSQDSAQQAIRALQQQLESLREKHAADQLAVVEQVEQLKSAFAAKVRGKPGAGSSGIIDSKRGAHEFCCCCCCCCWVLRQVSELEDENQQLRSRITVCEARNEELVAQLAAIQPGLAKVAEPSRPEPAATAVTETARPEPEPQTPPVTAAEAAAQNPQPLVGSSSEMDAKVMFARPAQPLETHSAHHVASFVLCGRCNNGNQRSSPNSASRKGVGKRLR